MFKIAPGICVFALAAAGLSARTAPNEPVQETRATGIVGITQGQTGRLNALNPGVAALANLALVVDQRREIRATITIPPVLPPSGSTTAGTLACKLIGTLEIFNTIDGHTLVTAPGG